MLANQDLYLIINICNTAFWLANARKVAITLYIWLQNVIRHFLAAYVISKLMVGRFYETQTKNMK